MPDSITTTNRGKLARAVGLGAAAAAALTAAALFTPNASAQDTELSPLTFTDRQVAVGRSTYGGNCSGCHADDLSGLDAPPLIRSEWRWFDGTVAEFFNYIQAAMPLDNPGTLNGRQMAGIIALIADANGFTAGDTPLPEDPAELTGMGFFQPE